MIAFKTKNEYCRSLLELADIEIEKKIKQKHLTQDKLEKSAKRILDVIENRKLKIKEKQIYEKVIAVSIFIGLLLGIIITIIVRGIQTTYFR